MRVSRIFFNQKLVVGDEVMLPLQSSKHISAVLRMHAGEPIILFNGTGGEYAAEIVAVNKKQVIAKPIQFVSRDLESPLKIHLGQAISRGERMDLTIQKAVELGVFSITPLFTERCGVQLSGERLRKRMEHWRAVVISACEQCGRNAIPEVHIACSLREWLARQGGGLCLTLDHRAQRRLSDIDQVPSDVTLLVGSEGGLSVDEIELSRKANFVSINFGQRILRTETASLAAISALQTIWGDL